jgi:hypothetical protein
MRARVDSEFAPQATRDGDHRLDDKIAQQPQRLGLWSIEPFHRARMRGELIELLDRDAWETTESVLELSRAGLRSAAAASVSGMVWPRIVPIRAWVPTLMRLRVANI